MDSPVEIVCASDQNYFDGLLVTVVSMAMFAKKDAALSFHILDGGITDESYAFLCRKVVEAHAKSNLQRIKINDGDWSGFPMFRGNRMAYARIFLPKLLADVDQVVYCDVDFLWLDDISEFWKLRDGCVILQAIRHELQIPSAYQNEVAFQQGLGLTFDGSQYVNTGLVIMNLEMMRKEDFCAKAIEFSNSHEFLPLADQSMYNVLLRGRICFLPEKWHSKVYNVDENTFAEGGAVIHYLGYNPFRPRWRGWILTDAFLLWHMVYARICGLSAWESLRSKYSVTEIVLRRFGSCLNSMPILGRVLRKCLCLTGHTTSVPELYNLHRRRFIHHLPKSLKEKLTT